MTLVRRIALTVVAILGIGGCALGVVAVSGQLTFLRSTRPMTVTLATPLDVSALAPGDTAQRLITITNTSGRVINRMTFRVARPDTTLAQSRSGLMVKLTLCTTPWTRRATTAPTYICRGIKKAVVGTRRLPIDRRLSGLPRTAPGGKLYFRIITLLRKDAGNGLQARRVTITPELLIGTAG